MNGSAKTKRVAVVGTGVAGLTCAYLLSDEFHVTVLESADTLGMDSASKTYAGARMDVPLRTFSADYYPNLTALYHKLGIEFSHANYEFALFKAEESKPYFTYLNFCHSELLRRLVGYDVVSLPRVISINPIKMFRYLSLMSEYYFFQKAGPFDLKHGTCANKNFKDYVLERYSEDFYYELLMPMLSVICTCSWEAVGNYPAEIIVDYLAGRSRDHPLGSTTLRATSGTTETVKRMSEKFDRVLTSCRVEKVVPGRNGAKALVSWRVKGSDVINQEEFDHVVIATQANAAKLILDGDEEQMRALAGIKYEKSRTILHTDESLIAPGFPGTCALSVRKGKESDCTIWMNRIDPQLGKALTQNVFQTWNPLKEPKEKPVVDVVFERPVVTMDTMENLDLLAKVNGRDGVWFVGAYALYSMPLLENGARSAIRVANMMLEHHMYPELGVQISGDSFATRRPDLADPDHSPLLRKRSKAAIVVDTFVISSYLALFVGVASLVAIPMVRALSKSSSTV